MRADNQGEGGILALTALLPRTRGMAAARGRAAGRPVLVCLGIFGAALLYGDGMITPAITVLGAVEGLEVATPLFSPYVVPIAGRHPDRHLRRSSSTARTASAGCSARSWCVWFVDARRARHRLDRAASRPCSARSIPRHARRLLPRQRLARLRRARRGVPGRHRRRGALRRHGALRQAADPPRLVRAGAAGAAAQLLRPGRAAAARPARPRSSRSSCWRRRGRCCRWSSSPPPPRSSRRRR